MNIIEKKNDDDTSSSGPSEGLPVTLYDHVYDGIWPRSCHTHIKILFFIYGRVPSVVFRGCGGVTEPAWVEINVFADAFLRHTPYTLHWTV